MTHPPSGKYYTSTPEATALRRTFVANVEARMRELGWVYVGGKANDGPAGKLQLARLSEVSGVPPRTIENLMRADNQPSLVGAAAVARALGVSLDTLLGQEDDFGVVEAPSGTQRVECIHTARHLPNLGVCQKCLNSWNTWQEKKRELYAASRRQAAADADASLSTHRAAVAATGTDPYNVKR